MVIKYAKGEKERESRGISEGGGGGGWTVGGRAKGKRDRVVSQGDKMMGQT